MTKWYGFRLALRLCYDEITCRGEALLQEMKWYDIIIKSGGVGFVWTKETSTADGITSENSEAPFYFYFLLKLSGRVRVYSKKERKRRVWNIHVTISCGEQDISEISSRNLSNLTCDQFGLRGVFECDVSDVICRLIPYCTCEILSWKSAQWHHHR